MITFEKAISEYLDFIKLKKKPQSFRSINSRLNNYVLPYFNKENIYDLKAIDYLKWQTQIDKLGFKYRYKKTLHYAVVGLLNFCMTFYDLEINVASKVGNFKNIDEVTNNINFWTINEFKKFISVVDNKNYKALFNFLFFTGCRQGEALALTFNDINDNLIKINKTISKEHHNGKRAITLPKTKKSIRNILIDSNLENEIQGLRDHYITNNKDFNNNFYIFGGISPLAPTTIERWKNYYCDKAKVKRIRIHDFRHSHATLLLSNNVPIIAISSRLGHSNTSITLDVYSHLVPEDEKRVIQTLNSLRLI